MNDSLGDRMKSYEQPFDAVLPPRMPTIIRLDGNCFHTFCRKMYKPFDTEFIYNMQCLAIELCQRISTVQIAYVQSDEITLLLHPYKRLVSQPWFGNRVNKMVSISAGMASSIFTQYYNKFAAFDSRVFVLPEFEVVNNFIWRQNDASRNSLSALAHHHFSHKSLQGKNHSDMHEMLHGIGINWNDLPTTQKRGSCIIENEDGWYIDNEIPIFTQDRDYIGVYLATDE